MDDLSAGVHDLLECCHSAQAGVQVPSEGMNHEVRKSWEIAPTELRILYEDIVTVTTSWSQKNVLSSGTCLLLVVEIVTICSSVLEVPSIASVTSRLALVRRTGSVHGRSSILQEDSEQDADQEARVCSELLKHTSILSALIDNSLRCMMLQDFCL